jgi:hypothetical protein
MPRAIGGSSKTAPGVTPWLPRGYPVVTPWLPRGCAGVAPGLPDLHVRNRLLFTNGAVTNRENYSTCIVQTYLSLVSAQARIEEMRSVVYGTYEIVRARTVRQLMAVAP